MLDAFPMLYLVDILFFPLSIADLFADACMTLVTEDPTFSIDFKFKKTMQVSYDPLRYAQY